MTIIDSTWIVTLIHSSLGRPKRSIIYQYSLKINPQVNLFSNPTCMLVDHAWIPRDFFWLKTNINKARSKVRSLGVFRNYYALTITCALVQDASLTRKMTRELFLRIFNYALLFNCWPLVVYHIVQGLSFENNSSLEKFVGESQSIRRFGHNNHYSGALFNCLKLFGQFSAQLENNSWSLIQNEFVQNNFLTRRSQQ